MQSTYTERETFGSQVIASGGIATLLTAAHYLGKKTNIASDFGYGGMYSLLGAEKVLAEGSFGAVYSTMSAEQLSRTLRIGNSSMMMSAGFGGIPQSQSIIGNMFSYGGGDRMMKGGLDKMHFGNLAFVLGMTGYFAVDAYKEGGAEGLGNFLIQDFFANKAGYDAVVQTVEITNASNFAASQKITDSLKAGQLVTEEGKVIRSANLHRTILGSAMLPRLISTMGAYQGAAVGMDIGRSIAETTTGVLNYGLGSDYISSSVTGFAGSIFGAHLGAKIGAAAFGTIGRGLLTLGGMLGLNEIKSYITSTLGSGSNLKHRGLNFSSNIAEFQTQAVATMRQRAVQSMHKSHMNARSAFGQEATILHTNRDLFSQYRR